ncbi:hypothetical protein Ahy_B06g084080 [Arachis hypogaea]|uniref:No apical meristem-associated C-terminal domain-containing protein n=1 Tax=Arachis hypogaea TaxID=3818 RepID=A0A444YR57_ARAHY|nr:hypothetical protein Ahy_B06g084080 [Arachis hypogaea]
MLSTSMKMTLKIVGKIVFQHWQWEEDEILISAWLNISTSHIVGTDQKGKIFWSGIHSYCVEFNSDVKGGQLHVRNDDSPVRPQGSKKSKRKGKRKAQIFEDLSEKKSSVAKKLSLMEVIKNVREKELMDREKEREEESEHREKMMAIKEKELQIQAAMKEQELQTHRYIKEMEINAKEMERERMAKEKEREMDIQILNADMSTMSEKRRALHEIACEKIINK